MKFIYEPPPDTTPSFVYSFVDGILIFIALTLLRVTLILYYILSPLLRLIQLSLTNFFVLGFIISGCLGGLIYAMLWYKK